jgi:hypothetical protein
VGAAAALQGGQRAALRAEAQLQIDVALILRCNFSAPASAERVWRANERRCQLG